MKATGDASLPFGPQTSYAPVSTHSLFVGLVLTAENGDVEAYLVNNTAAAYTRVLTRTGMYAGDDDFIESTVGVRERGALPPFSAVLLEASPWWERDFYIWYRLELWSVDRTDEPLHAHFGIPKQVWTLPKKSLPILEKEGGLLFERTNEGGSGSSSAQVLPGLPA